MTVPLSNQGAPGNSGNPGLAQDRPDMDFRADAGLGKEARNGGSRREDAGDMAVSAAFALQLASLRAAPAADDDSEHVVVAAPPPPPLIPGLEADADPAIRQRDVSSLTQTLVAQVEAGERIRLGGNGPVTMTVPLAANALGLTEARLVASKGELTVVFPLRAGADPALVNAAIGDLAQALAQRYPARTIRLRSEEEGRNAADPAEFNPFKEPVGRRK